MKSKTFDTKDNNNFQKNYTKKTQIITKKLNLNKMAIAFF